MSASTSLYLSLPMVRLLTMLVSAAPSAPARAAAVPPPGIEALEASTSANSCMVFSAYVFKYSSFVSWGFSRHLGQRPTTVVILRACDEIRVFWSDMVEILAREAPEVYCESRASVR